jgi:flagellin-like hook-associated protein FlgL
LANTKEQGKFIFAGTNTQTKPFGFMTEPPGGFDWANLGIDWDDPLTWSLVPDVVGYSGNLGLINLDISVSSEVATNMTGEYVFQGSRDLTDPAEPLNPNQDLFIAITILRDGMKSNDSELIRRGYDNIRAIKDRMNQCLTTVGSRHVSIETTQFNLEDFNESLQTIQNAYDGVDYPASITRFAAEQNAQQAALQMIARMGRNNLFDYIG